MEAAGYRLHGASWWRGAKVGDVVSARRRRREVTTVRLGATLASALDTLAAAGVLSAPVTDCGVAVGVLDVRDVARGLLDLVDVPLDAPCPRNSPQAWERVLTWTASKADTTPLASVAREDDGALVPEVIVSDASLAEVLSPSGLFGDLASSRSRHHRVFLTGVSGDVQDVVSQSDVLRFAVERHSGAFNGLASEPVGPELAARHDVVSVSVDTPAIEALHALVWHNVPIVAVVEGSDSELVGCFSSSDLRNLSTRRLEALALPLRDFLHLVERREGGATLLDAFDATAGLNQPVAERYRRVAEAADSLAATDALSHRCVRATAGMSVLQVAGRTVAQAVHHVFLCDDAAMRRLVAVVSVGDLLATALSKLAA